MAGDDGDGDGYWEYFCFVADIEFHLNPAFHEQKGMFFPGTALDKADDDAFITFGGGDDDSSSTLFDNVSSKFCYSKTRDVCRGWEMVMVLTPPTQSMFQVIGWAVIQILRRNLDTVVQFQICHVRLGGDGDGDGVRDGGDDGDGRLATVMVMAVLGLGMVVTMEMAG